MDDNKIDITTLNKIQKKETVLKGLSSFCKILAIAASVHSPVIGSVATALSVIMDSYGSLSQNSLSTFADSINNKPLSIVNLHYEDVSPDKKPEINKTNEKIITEILLPDQKRIIDTEESPIITLSPINDKVLKYLAENPEELYRLTSNDFEMVMAEIYSKLGYDVTRTQATHDGGKDIIIRKKEILGDFIYYVECKKYAPERHIGVGIVRNLVGTVNTDRVNGGILATTSFFTEDARKFILDNKWNCQIKMHDYDVIQELLKKSLKH